MASAASLNNHTIEVVEVPFYGDVIEAARDTRDGTAYVSIRRVCENLGVAIQSQLEKLKGCHWARITMIVTHDQLGRQQELAFLPLTQVPAWLTHINPDKIGGGPEQVEKLKQYQLEAVDVLYKHFVKSQDPIVALAQSVIATRQAQLALEGRVDVVQQRVDDLVELQAAALNVLTDIPRADDPPAPLTTRAKINMLVRDYAAAHNVEYKDIWSAIYKQLNYRYGFDARRRAKNAGISMIEAVERAGMMEELYKVASAVCS